MTLKLEDVFGTFVLYLDDGIHLLFVNTYFIILLIVFFKLAL